MVQESQEAGWMQAGSRIWGAFVGHGQAFKFHSQFRWKLVKDFNQGNDMMGFEFLTVYWLKDMEWIGGWPEKKWSVK